MGLARRPERRAPAGGRLLLTLAGMLTTGLFFGYVRQRLLLLRFRLTLAAVALVWITERLRKLTSGFTFLPTEPSARALRLLGGLAAVFLLLELSGTKRAGATGEWGQRGG